MNQDHDPWDWVNDKKVVAPLAAGVQTSQEPNPGVVQGHADPMMQMAQQGAVGATAKGLEAGYKAYGAAANPMGPLSAEQLGASFASDMAAQGVASAALPVAAEAAAGTAATAGTTAAATSALGTAAGVGGEAALAAMGPVGWAIGAGLLAKKLGIF